MSVLSLNPSNTLSFLKVAPQEVQGRSLIKGGSFDFIKLANQPQIQLLLNSLLSAANLPANQTARSLGRAAQMLLQLGVKVSEDLVKESSPDRDLTRGLEKSLQISPLEKDLGQSLELSKDEATHSKQNDVPKSQDKGKSSPIFAKVLNFSKLNTVSQELAKRWHKSKRQTQQSFWTEPQQELKTLPMGRWALLGLSGSGLGILCLISSLLLNN